MGITIEDLYKRPIEKEAETIVKRISNLQKAIYAMKSKEDISWLRIGTVLTLAVLKKAKEGKSPKSFTKNDFIEIQDIVTEIGMNMDGQNYSIFVFDLYAAYITWNLQNIDGNPKDEEYAQIIKLTEELSLKKQQLQGGQIKETVYVRDSLELCLEAIMKLFSYQISRATGEDLGNLIQAVNAFSFEYGRLMLYQWELAIVDEYLRKQKRIDVELQEKFDAYVKELAVDSRKIRILINHAFDPGFRNSLIDSVQLAMTIGVKKADLLCSERDIDSYFLD